MKHPRSTGQAAQFLNSTEPQLAELVRSGKIHPAPEVLAGRRLWEPEHILQAAEALGVNLRTYHDWKSGRHAPRGLALDFLHAKLKTKIPKP